MSLLRTFERASSCRNTYQIAPQSLFAFLCPALHDTEPVKSRKHARGQRSELSSEQVRMLPPPGEMDNCFIAALVQAGSCQGRVGGSRKRAPLLSLAFGSQRTQPQPVFCLGRQRRELHSKPTRPTRESSSAQTISKEDLHSLVDIYGTRKEKEVSEGEELSDIVGVGPEVLDKPWDETYFTDNQYMVCPALWSEAVGVIEHMKLLLEHPEPPHEELYRLYQRLPGNRVNYIPSEVLFKLITHLSQVSASRFHKEYADGFLSILYDMRAENIPVNLTLWTTAIRFLGLSEGARQAVRLWREMEQHYGIKGNSYTFSILFDLAVKSQHFALAEMIEKEARDRHIKLDRISRMSRIFYYGILGDGQGVRRAYAQLVDAGEIVDTAVLTNVITALIDAGELPAAEETFERMKQLHAGKKGATQAPHNWRQRRELRVLLTDAAHRYRDRPQDRQTFQDAAPIDPDWRTYRAFIRYHALESGDWNRIEELLDEMKKAGIELNREIYRCLFGGFAKHGGIQLTSWNKKNLDIIWIDFERSCQRDPTETSIDSGLAVMIVKAFFYCVDKRRARVAWEAILERWTPTHHVQSKVERLLQQQKRWQSEH